MCRGYVLAAIPVVGSSSLQLELHNVQERALMEIPFRILEKLNNDDLCWSIFSENLPRTKTSFRRSTGYCSKVRNFWRVEGKKKKVFANFQNIRSLKLEINHQRINWSKIQKTTTTGLAPSRRIKVKTRGVQRRYRRNTYFQRRILTHKWSEIPYICSVQLTFPV